MEGFGIDLRLTNVPQGPDADKEIRRLGAPRKEFVMSDIALKALPKDWTHHAGGADNSKVKKKFLFPKNVSLKVSKPTPENKFKSDFWRKEQKQIKLMLGVLAHGANGLAHSSC